MSKTQTTQPLSSIRRPSPEEYRQGLEKSLRIQLQHVVTQSLVHRLAYREAALDAVQVVFQEIYAELEQSVQAKKGVQ